jgi:hypothetical protein
VANKTARKIALALQELGLAQLAEAGLFADQFQLTPEARQCLFARLGDAAAARVRQALGIATPEDERRLRAGRSLHPELARSMGELAAILPEDAS